MRELQDSAQPARSSSVIVKNSASESASGWEADFEDDKINYKLIKLANEKSSLFSLLKNYGIKFKREKPVVQLTPDGNFIARYSSVKEASKILGISASNIIDICMDRIKTIKEYVWVYENQYDINKTYFYKSKKLKPTIKLLKTHKFIHKYLSV